MTNDLPDVGDMVCEHGTAMDVHCCNCHSGFLFDINLCVCNDKPQPCPECDGKGSVLDAPANVLTGRPYWTECLECHGTGVIRPTEDKRVP